MARLTLDALDAIGPEVTANLLALIEALRARRAEDEELTARLLNPPSPPQP